MEIRVEWNQNVDGPELKLDGVESDHLVSWN